MSTTFANSIDSNPIYADRAENDKDGNRIDQTYAKSASLATVATTGAYSDLSGTPSIPTKTSDLTNDSNFITLSDVPAQVQADWTEADSNDPSYIQNKPTLATVATSGSYNDLTDTPTIPTVPVTDVTVDGVSVVSNGTAAIVMPTIPVTDVEVDGTSVLNAQGVAEITLPTFTQAQADWTEADSNDPSYIQNKPTLATVATSGAYSDLSGTPTINNVPAVTSNDDNKVLKASYTGGVGSYSWEQESGGTVTDVEVDGTSVVSGGVASITMPTELVPTVTSNDDGKILKAAYSGGTGSYSWETESGGAQADWAEDDPLEQSYIENKPVPKTLVAGTNITISENSSTLTVAATWQNAQADWTETDPNEPAYIQHKPTLATVATSGDYTDLSNTPTIPTVDQTYDASSTNAQSGVAVASAISAAVIPISVVSTLPASPDPNTLYVVTGA